MGAPENFIANARKVAYTNFADVDKVLEIFTGSMTVPVSGTGALDLYFTHDTGIADFTYFAGYFAVDGGNGSDIGAHYIGNTSYLTVVGASQNNALKIYAVNFDNVQHTVVYQVAVLAKPSNTLFTIPSNIPNNKPYLDSRLNYQKIAFEATIPIVIPAGDGLVANKEVLTIPVPHGLGYRPNVRSFVDNGTSLTHATGNNFGLLFAKSMHCRVKLDNNNVNFVFLNSSTSTLSLNLSYRIYYDSNQSL